MGTIAILLPQFRFPPRPTSRVLDLSWETPKPFLLGRLDKVHGNAFIGRAVTTVRARKSQKKTEIWRQTWEEHNFCGEEAHLGRNIKNRWTEKKAKWVRLWVKVKTMTHWTRGAEVTGREKILLLYPCPRLLKTSYRATAFIFSEYNVLTKKGLPFGFLWKRPDLSDCCRNPNSFHTFGCLTNTLRKEHERECTWKSSTEETGGEGLWFLWPEGILGQGTRGWGLCVTIT